MSQQIMFLKPKSFNPPLFFEEVVAAGLPIGEAGRILAWDWSGFIPPSERNRIDPFTETTVIGGTNIDGVVTPVTAEPGEINVTVPDDWAAGETTTLDGVLDAHDYTNTTAEQDRQAQDTTDGDDLLVILEAGPPYTFTPDQIAQIARLTLRNLRREQI